MRFRSHRNPEVKKKKFSVSIDEVYTPHPKQQQFRELIDKGCQTVLFLGGRQSGKTFAGAWEFVRQIFVYQRKPYLYWVIAPSYAVARVAKRYLFDNPLVRSCIEYGNRREDVYTLKVPHITDDCRIVGNHTAQVEIRTAQEPDLLRGAVCACVWIDEAAFIPQECWNVIQPVVLASGGNFILTTTPKGRNYLYDMFVARRNDPAFGYVVSKTHENPHISKGAIDKLKEQYSDTLARQELEAEFVAYEGLVYTLLPNAVQQRIEVNPRNCVFYGGCDFGYADPFAFVWIAYDVVNDTFHVLDEYYQRHEVMETHIDRIKAHPLSRVLKTVYCDPSNPDGIRRMIKAGLPAVAALNRQIMDGINIVQMLLDKGKLNAQARCKETLREFGNYAFRESSNKNAGDKPVDMFNHAMDAMRYAITSAMITLKTRKRPKFNMHEYFKNMRQLTSVEEGFPTWYDSPAEN